MYFQTGPRHTERISSSGLWIQHLPWRFGRISTSGVSRSGVYILHSGSPLYSVLVHHLFCLYHTMLWKSQVGATTTSHNDGVFFFAMWQRFFYSTINSHSFFKIYLLLFVSFWLGISMNISNLTLSQFPLRYKVFKSYLPTYL